MFEGLRNPEIELLGFFLPWGLVMGVMGFLLAWVAVLALEKAGWTKYIWHLPLFFVALCLVFTFGLGLIFQP